MSRLLAIDTATEACSAALWIDGELHEQYAEAPREHAKRLLPMVETLLAEASLKLGDLDALAFGRGPGSFTGVRIAAGMAQGLAFSAGLPVVPVSTLAALAQGAADVEHPRLLAAIDARMGEVYWARYLLGADGLVSLDGDERVCAPEDAPVPSDGGWFGVGSGWKTYEERLATCLGNVVSGFDGARYPRASDVARLAVPVYERGAALPAERAIPVYLRDRVANKPG
jgi:tRNA threonylcarbamoyladenosine biosynthesis protein TsaB